MRSDQIRLLFEIVAQGDTEAFLDIAREVIRDEERKNHHMLANDLRRIVSGVPASPNQTEKGRVRTHLPVPRDTERGFPLLEIDEYELDWSDVILADELTNAIGRIVEEVRQAEVLASYGLRPKQRVLFYGPPGTGKTLTAHLISSVLGIPLVLVRFEAIISSFLGETAANLRRIFDFIAHGQWVVLFDEFDIIGKQRDDPHEHGEIKRVVNNLMQMIDSYNASSLLIAATNHEHLLDPGLWRRFDEILYFGMPDSDRRHLLFRKYLRSLALSDEVVLSRLVSETEAFSPSDIAQTCTEALKRVILKDHREVGMSELMWAVSEQRRRKALEVPRHGGAVRPS